MMSRFQDQVDGRRFKIFLSKSQSHPAPYCHEQTSSQQTLILNLGLFAVFNLIKAYKASKMYSKNIANINAKTFISNFMLLSYKKQTVDVIMLQVQRIFKNVKISSQHKN